MKHIDNKLLQFLLLVMIGFFAIPSKGKAELHILEYLESQDVLAYGLCRNVKNYDQSEKTLIVPTFPKIAWQNFIQNPPKEIKISECVHLCKTENVGTKCVDGAIYAGTLDGNRLYAAPVVEGKYAWNAAPTNFVASGTVSLFQGKENTAMLVGRSRKGAEYDAALICHQKGAEWYLPALSELNVIAANFKSIVGEDPDTIQRIDGQYFWSSTETSNDSAYATIFDKSRTFTPFIKAALLSVWCVRQELELDKP